MGKNPSRTHVRARSPYGDHKKMPDLWNQAFWQENARFRILAASLYPGADFKSYEPIKLSKV